MVFQLLLKVGHPDVHVYKAPPIEEIVRKVTVRDKLLDLFHFLMRKKNPKTENPSESDETAKSPNSEVRQMEENKPEAERVTDIQEPRLRTGADEVNGGQEDLAFEDELPSPTHNEELDELGVDAENHGDEADIVNGKEKVEEISQKRIVHRNGFLG